MNSGLDTEAIVQGLVEARQIKVDETKKAQTKLEWKQDAWKTLNSKFYSFYTGTLTSMTYASSYMKKATTVSDDSIANVLTANTAMNAEQNLVVSQLAKTSYLTGSQIKDASGNLITSANAKLFELGIETGSSFSLTVGTGDDAKTTEITIGADATVSDLITQLKDAGLRANFDSKNNRIYLSAQASGAANDFTFTASSQDGYEAMSTLGLLSADGYANMLAVYNTYAALDENETAIDEMVATQAPARATKAKADSEALALQIDELTNSANAASDAYDAKYAVAPATISLKDMDNAALVAHKTSLEDALNAVTDDTTLTAQQKTDKKADIKEQQEALDAYIAQRAQLDDMNEEKVKLDSYYSEDDEGNISATTDLLALVKKDITDQAAEAAAKLSDPAFNLTALQANAAIKIDGQDAEIWLNGAKYVSESNNIEVNGLTITAKGVSKDSNNDDVIDAKDNAVTLTTADDASGLYDMLKKFVTEYNKLINEIDKLYGADSAKGYEPLTADEKDVMSEKEVEEYEKKIKDALLRKDSTLGAVSSALTTVMGSSFAVNGEYLSLASFGIEKLGYFISAENEKNAYHILGDEDDPEMLAQDNALKALIAQDPNKVSDFFQQLSKSLYDTSKKLMARESGYKSSLTIYADVKLKEDYNDYSDRIKKMEEDLQAYEDSWFDKFTAMETALAKLQSNTNAISGLLGG
jgi:flagellar hook-associated protein 2